MERWYRDLLVQGEDAARDALREEYDDHAEALGRLRGRVLDVGGGAGLTAKYLSPDCDYWVVDPAPVWNERDWKAFAGAFVGGGPTPRFVSGTGEALPFGDAEFDAVLAMWSLNHVRDGERCLREMIRTLRTGGTLYVVLEDMEPRWADIARAVPRWLRYKLGRGERPRFWHQVGGIAATARHKLAGREWPLQHDHIRIEDDLFARRDLRHVRRAWKGGYLTIECRKA